MNNKKIHGFCIKFVMLLLFICELPSSSAYAQKTISGCITDSETGETLPVAQIQIVGTRSGTIANDNGEYILELETLPSTIQISYIGYNTEKITITDDSPDELNIMLKPSPVMMNTVVVSPDDPAVRIMKEVIRRKQEWRATLETYSAEAYTRISLENEKKIVSISESVSDINWGKNKGPREIIKAKRQTSNIDAKNNFASARMTPNFYDDNIDIVGYKAIGPTHPQALKFYDFKLIGQGLMDDTVVYEISVIPKSRLQPTFVGTVSVLDKEYAMIKVDLKPNETILFPWPINKLTMSFEQQFSNFGQNYWLPVDVRTTAEIKIKLPGLSFPTIKFNQLTRITDYDVNVAVPDSTIKKEKKTVTVAIGNGVSVTVDEKENPSDIENDREDSTNNLAAESEDAASADEADTFPGDKTAQSDTDSLTTAENEEVIAPDPESKNVPPKNIYSKAKSDSIFAAREQEIIPYTEEEQEAYSTIDSTMTMEKAFKPTGVLARLIKDSDKKKKPRKQRVWTKPVSLFFSVFNLQGRYNRVDGYNIGLTHKKKIKTRFTYELFGSYLTAREKWSYGSKVNYRWGKKRNGFISMDYMTGTVPRYHSGAYPFFVNSIQTLCGQSDYFDYFRNNKLGVELGYRFRKIKSKVSAKINYEHHTSVRKTTDHNLLGRDKEQRENPAVAEGRLRSAALFIVYGNENVPFGIVGQNTAEFTVEHSSRDFLSSDFSFTRLQIALDWRFNTFLRRRLFPNTLDVRFVGGASRGNLPIQRFGIVDGTITAFSPFGVLRSLRNHPLEGEQYCALFWEHNFKTIPFELLGLQWLTEKGIGIIVHGASGRTWITEKRLSQLSYKPYYNDRFLHEIGFSVNSLFKIMRLDVTKRLDKHGLFVGFGISRMF